MSYILHRFFREKEFNCIERSIIVKGITTLISIGNIIFFLGFLFLQSITKNVRL